MEIMAKYMQFLVIASKILSRDVPFILLTSHAVGADLDYIDCALNTCHSAYL